MQFTIPATRHTNRLTLACGRRFVCLIAYAAPCHIRCVRIGRAAGSVGRPFEHYRSLFWPCG